MTDCPKYQNGDLVTEDFISRAISCFRNNERLDRATILSLVHAAQDVFTSQPSLLEINIEGKELFTVCGDVHGKQSKVCLLSLLIKGRATLRAS